MLYIYILYTYNNKYILNVYTLYIYVHIHTHTNCLIKILYIHSVNLFLYLSPLDVSISHGI